MIALFAGLGALTAVLTFAVVSRRLRGTTRSRRSDERVEATEVSSWMSELMDAMSPAPPVLFETHDLAAVPSGPPNAVAHFGD